MQNLIIKNILILTLVIFSTSFALNDAPEPWQFGFQDPATPIMEGIINFHNHIMFFLTVIGIAVMWLLGRCITLYDEDVNLEVDNFTHSTTLEIVWTIVPALILMVIAVPSFALLYSMDEMIDPAITLKVVGHQWYWSYEYSDYNHTTEDGEGINFDSYMIAEEDLNLRGPGEFLGQRQSGLPEFILADLAAHRDLLVKAREQAQAMLVGKNTNNINLLLSLFERDSAVKFLAAG